MTTYVQDQGHYPAKLAKDLKQGDVIIQRGGRAKVLSAIVGEKNVFLRLTGKAYTVNTWKRLDTKVAIERKAC